MFSEFCKKCDSKDYCINRGSCLRNDIDDFNGEKDLEEETELSDDEAGLIEDDGMIDIQKLFKK